MENNKEKNESQKKGGNYIVSIDKEIQQGVYANAATIHYTHNECIIDFLYTLPGVTPKQMKAVSRVNMSHNVAKSFLSALSNATLDFENKKTRNKLTI